MRTDPEVTNTAPPPAPAPDPFGLTEGRVADLLLGPAHRTLLPAAALFGGAFLVLADALARTIVSPAELPIGLVTSLVGGPFFLWLLARGRRHG